MTTDTDPRMGEMSTAIDAFARYQEFRRFSPATIDRRRASLTSLARFLHPAGLGDATTELLEEWLTTFAAPRTRNAYRSDVRAFYAWARKRGVVGHDPAAELDSIRVPRTLPRPLDGVVVRTLIDAAPSWRIRTALALAAYAGLRRSELAHLDAEDVHLDSRPPILVVRNGKGGKDRIVPVHPALGALLAERRRGPVFVVGSKRIAEEVGAHMRRHGVHASLHQLRHSFATEAMRGSGGNVPLVMHLMGHASPETTMGYAGWAGGDAGPVVSRLYAV